jgi:hypothetical protein
MVDDEDRLALGAANPRAARADLVVGDLEPGLASRADDDHGSLTKGEITPATA